MTEESEPLAEASPERTAPPRLLAAVLYCENCGGETPHRIVRLDRSSRPEAGRVRGIARCRQCRWTGPFETVVPGEVEVAQIVSEGPRSVRTRVRLPRRSRVQVGSRVPGSVEPFRVHRIEIRSGKSAKQAVTDEVATLWVTPDTGSVVRVSVADGPRTWTARLTLPPHHELAVGEDLTVEDVAVRVAALRARGHTWRKEGDRFRAAEVERVYGRRKVIPPAGRSPWRSDRETPRSRASSRSTRSRSRSSPGERRTRTAPRARTAEGGATVHRVSPS